ncbi:MAG: hypothetical protein ACI4TA_12170 [Acetatifactor sp.]
MKRRLCAVLMGIMLLSTGMTCFAHVHDYQVRGKVLYNVKPGGSHLYQNGIKSDPITGQQTPTYGTCYYRIEQYKGVWTCDGCNATNGDYYYPDEVVHSSCSLHR